MQHPGGRAAFVGRERELAQLSEVWRDVKTGRFALALIDGDAGIGKTRLAQEFAARAERLGARVLWGDCVDLRGSGLTYAPFRHALRDVGENPNVRALLGDIPARVADLLDGPAVDGRGGRPGALFETLLELLRALARTRPLLLVIEDLHLADNTTLDVLTYLVHNLGGIPVLGLLTGRALREPPSTIREPEEATAQFLAGQASSAIAQWIRLAALSEHETAQLLEELTDSAASAREVGEIFSRSGGNPMFVEELVAERARGDGQLSPTLRQLLSGRIRHLPDDVREVLGVAAVAGQSVARDDLRAVVDRPRDVLSRLLRQAIDAGVLVEDPGGHHYAFRQALMQEVLYEDLPSERRRELHRRFADVLETRGRTTTTATGAVATHWDRAGYPDRALPAYLAAADAAREIFAFVDAGRFLQRAYALWDEVDHPETLSGLTRRHLANKTIEQVVATDDAATAIPIARDTLGDAERTAEHRVIAFQRMQLARALWFSDDEGTALEQTRIAADAVSDEGPSPEQARILALWAGLLALNGRYTDAGALTRRALKAARRSGAPRAYRYAMLTAGTVAAAQGDLTGGLKLIDEAEDLARRRSDADEAMRAMLHRGRVLQRYGRWEAARQVYVDGLAAAPKYGMSQHYTWRLHVLAARMSYCLGRWEEAADEIDLATTQIPGRGAALPSLLVATGQFDKAEAFYTRPRSRWRSDGTGRLQVPEGPVELAAWLGRLGDAHTTCDEALAFIDGSEELMPEARLCRAALRAEADAVERGEIPVAEAMQQATPLADRLRSLHAAHPARTDGYGRELQALAAAGDAEWLRITGRPDSDAWAHAADHWEALAMPYPYAYARWQQARALATRQRDRQGIAALRAEALAIAERLGAHPLRAAILGLRLEVSRVTASSPLDALTPRERDVVKLVIQGHSNRQIASMLGITEGTASVHVSRILRKLGAASRGQVIAMFARGDPPS
jgi:DNA-binding CsgD family transcriptional regulator